MNIPATRTTASVPILVSRGILGVKIPAETAIASVPTVLSRVMLKRKIAVLRRRMAMVTRMRGEKRGTRTYG